MSKNFPHTFIAIEGNVGAGKTTFCQMMEHDFGCKLILEQFTDNPFLPLFYEHPERYAFPVELFFMTERHKQLQEMLTQGELFSETIIADYFLIKTLLFAKNNLKDEEFRLFQRLFQVLNSTFRKPDLLVYLHRPVDDLMRNIQNRGREMESGIRPEYLQQIQQAYFDYFKTHSNLPVLVLNLESVNFWEEASTYQAMIGLLREHYEPGVHFREISQLSPL